MDPRLDTLLQLTRRQLFNRGFHAAGTAALTTLSELSLQTQVILFTHHRHLLDLAKQHLKPGDFHEHHLALT